MKRSILFAILALGLSGCVMSPAEVVSKRDAVSDPRLVGTWSGKDSDHVVITSSRENIYGIEHNDGDGKTARYEGRLGRLGETLVLDIVPNPQGADIDDLYIPGHLLVTVNWNNTNEIETRFIKPEPLFDAIRAGKVRIPCEPCSDSYNDRASLMLLGNTKQLRAELSKYISNPKALEEPIRWRRAGAALR